MQPYVPLIFAAVCLQPWISINMTDHPAGIHLISRSHRLRMQFSSRNSREASIYTLKYTVSHKTGAKPLRMVKLKIISFRLGMSVRQIPGPVPPVIQDFSQNHIGCRLDVVVKDRIDSSLGRVAEKADAGIDPGGICRGVEFSGKVTVVVGRLHKDFTLRLGSDLHWCSFS